VNPLAKIVVVACDEAFMAIVDLPISALLYRLRGGNWWMRIRHRNSEQQY
jgi:hypothetical protein